ncbi:hypothetical protein FAZ19_05730 [Sphingobacterium alkalisoli]|uniref:Uncharacterized protein n=1 Tax=Sphingobacterium alkalisoli TaxID=1874115 RepID=A0A4U0H7Q8_9SPHI|nr:DUF6443 domain-containing protein [Sphingobacterium alkalisoli]TJY66422.1 hypothetical protein FAZ19_05730 [Sphingobacterium alkalisoli]GGH16502.1 hypothetical protein GCM10011418_18930 [Sphingobacterium alkalisoli]
MKRIYIGFRLIALLSLISGKIAAQGTNPIFTSYSGQSELYGTQSVTLSAGFGIPLGYSVLIHVTPNNGSNAYSSDRNYVLTTAYNTPVATSVADPTVQQASRQITYYDGFGRPAQQIAIKGSVTNKDVVVPIVYDTYGRPSTGYLPYTTNSAGNGFFKTNAVTEQKAFYTAGIFGQSTNSHPYSTTVYDLSPQARVKEQGTPGAQWQPLSGSIPGSGHTVKFEGMVNGAGIPRYIVSLDPSNTPSLVKNGDYGHHQLVIDIVKDQNWSTGDGKIGTTEKFTDKSGRVILERAFTQTGTTLVTLSTYYVYDDWGRLTFILPPGTDPDTSTPDANKIGTFGYSYQYDNYGRKVEVKQPGKGVEYFVYNKRHQLVASQGANQRNLHQWKVNKYDAHGRVISTGTWTNNNLAISRIALQTVLDGQTVFWESRNSNVSTHGYTNISWPTNTSSYDLINYYDTYDIAGLPANFAFQSYTGNVQITKAPGMLTGSKTWSMNSTTTALWSAIYYDLNGQVIQMQAGNHLGGREVVNNSYNFVGELISAERTHYNPSSALLLTVKNTHEYDPTGRLLNVKQKINTQDQVTLAAYTYNELGQVVDKKLHQKQGQTKYLQSIDYRYNEKGQLKSINDPDLVGTSALNDGDNDSNLDLFGLQIAYHEDPIAPQYNGNIANIRWKTSKVPAQSVAPPKMGYQYRYDDLNRMTSAISEQGGTVDNAHNETLSYDINGNINSLQRNAFTGGSVQQIDNLAFTYDGYRTKKIDDLSTSASKQLGYDDKVKVAEEHFYDAEGNMIQDLNKAISLTYNDFNLINQVSFGTNHKLEILYDRTGKKLQAKYTNGASVYTIDYLDGIQYQQGQIAFIHTGEGRARLSGTTYTYEYDIKDHLNNVRVTFIPDPANVNQTVAKVIQQNSYYAYGLPMYGDANLHLSYISGEKSKFLYSDKELYDQGGLNWFDHGSRMYDPAIGRWSAMDPATQFANPYLAMGNNPALYVDPNGEFIFAIPALAYLAKAIAIGVGMSALSYAAETSMSDGGFDNWNWGQFGKSVAIGAASGAVSFGIGSAAGAIGGAIGQTGGAIFQTLGHSAWNGAVSSINGGSFWTGAITGAASNIIAGATSGISPAGQILTSAVSGGVASGLSGGSFWQGASTGAIVAGANHLLHNPTSQQEGDDPNPNRNPNQDRPLTPGEIKQIQRQGWGHGDKSMNGRGGGRNDLWVDKKGNVYEKPKYGKGVMGEWTGYNLKNLSVQVGIGASLFYGTYKLLNQFNRFATPFIMNITIMNLDPRSQYQQGGKL